MYNFWIDPQAPLEVEDIFLHYGTQQQFKKGETLLDMYEPFDTYYYVADGLVAVLSTAYDSEYYIAKIIPESRTFGFTNLPKLDNSGHEIRALRDSVVYTINAVDMNTMVDEGYVDRRILGNYKRAMSVLDNKAESLVHSINALFRHTVVINSITLSKPTYRVFNQLKTLDFTPDEANELASMYTDYAHISLRDNIDIASPPTKSNINVSTKKQDLKSIH